MSRDGGGRLSQTDSQRRCPMSVYVLGNRLGACGWWATHYNFYHRNAGERGTQGAFSRRPSGFQQHVVEAGQETPAFLPVYGQQRPLVAIGAPTRSEDALGKSGAQMEAEVGVSGCAHRAWGHCLHPTGPCFLCWPKVGVFSSHCPSMSIFSGNSTTFPFGEPPKVMWSLRVSPPLSTNSRHQVHGDLMRQEHMTQICPRRARPGTSFAVAIEKEAFPFHWGC